MHIVRMVLSVLEWHFQCVRKTLEALSNLYGTNVVLLSKSDLQLLHQHVPNLEVAGLP